MAIDDYVRLGQTDEAYYCPLCSKITTNTNVEKAMEHNSSILETVEQEKCSTALPNRIAGSVMERNLGWQCSLCTGKMEDGVEGRLLQHVDDGLVWSKVFCTAGEFPQNKENRCLEGENSENRV